jgi:dihydroxy-acid dehydratase
VAIAKEAGIDLPLGLFDKLSRSTPHISSILPGGKYYMEDLDAAGGVPAILKRILPLLNDVPTVSGKTISQIAKRAEICDEDVIRPLRHPYHKEGGIAILKGNLAPHGAVVKQSAVSDKMLKFKGKAMVFDSEEEAMKDILAGRIKKGSVIVIRYECPKGGPGMREMLAATSAIVGLGLSDHVALITDGRFSGGTQGPCIGHISPPAIMGGPLAAVKNGDEIIIDIPRRKLEVKLSKAQIKSRLAKHKHPEPKVKSGHLARYAKHVTSAHKGAVLEI